ncbi:MAG: sensor histidine kinase [Flavobacteriales bacterium]
MEHLKFHQPITRPPSQRKISYRAAFLISGGAYAVCIGILAFFLISYSDLGTGSGLLILFAFTAVTMGVLLYFLNKITEPTRLMSNKLNKYISGESWQKEQLHFNDESGNLYVNLDTCVSKLEKNIKEKNELYSLLSHDLKGLLATLQASLMLIEIENQDTSLHTHIHEKVEMIERQIFFINSLLYLYNEKEIPHARSDFQSFSLSGLVSELCDVFSSATRLENKRIRVELDPGLSIVSNRFLFRHLMFNILDNAVKYAEEGTEIHVSAEKGFLVVKNVYRSEEKAQSVFFRTWKKSTGMGRKFIEKTTQDLGLTCFVQSMNNTFEVKITLAGREQLSRVAF